MTTLTFIACVAICCCAMLLHKNFMNEISETRKELAAIHGEIENAFFIG